MTTTHPLTLISHSLCPYVQRAAIVLAEKGIVFERKDIDLAHKPGWFLEVSPLGKTPVLLVGEQAVFESAVICEYLDDTAAPRLHPEAALQRAQHRSWMEFGSAVLNNIGAFYNAPSEEALVARARELRLKFQHLEAVLGQGPYFAGERFSMVDAAFGPVFRYFDVFDGIGDFGVFSDTPRVNAWRCALAQRASVRKAVSPAYPKLLQVFLQQRGSALSRRMAARPELSAEAPCS
ncbi:MAG: glutathione S-transferase family protein [Pseudomonadota bacterium]